MESCEKMKRAIEDLANEKLVPVSNKLRGLSALFFCETLDGKELDGNEWCGISSLIKGFADELCSIYDEIHEITDLKNYEA